MTVVLPPMTIRSGKYHTAEYGRPAHAPAITNNRVRSSVMELSASFFFAIVSSETGGVRGEGYLDGGNRDNANSARIEARQERVHRVRQSLTDPLHAERKHVHPHRARKTKPTLSANRIERPTPIPPYLQIKDAHTAGMNPA